MYSLDLELTSEHRLNMLSMGPLEVFIPELDLSLMRMACSLESQRMFATSISLFGHISERYAIRRASLAAVGDEVHGLVTLSVIPASDEDISNLTLSTCFKLIPFIDQRAQWPSLNHRIRFTFVSRTTGTAFTLRTADYSDGPVRDVHDQFRKSIEQFGGGTRYLQWREFYSEVTSRLMLQSEELLDQYRMVSMDGSNDEQ